MQRLHCKAFRLSQTPQKERASWHGSETIYNSVSLDPILLLVCLHRKARTHDLILQSERFGVACLGRQWCRSVAIKQPELNPDKFKNVATRESYGVPILSDALATFICALHQKVVAGDHSIIIGRVLSCGSRAGTPQVPLSMPGQ